MSITTTPLGASRPDVAELAPIELDMEPRGDASAKLSWLKLRILSAAESQRVRALIRDRRPQAICEEISCPKLPECSGRGASTFAGAGQSPIRRCPVCALDQGRPLLSSSAEPRHLAEALRDMDVSYILITSGSGDDEPDGGAARFLNCITVIRDSRPGVRVEIVAPDFREKLDKALDLLAESPPDVIHHDLQTVPRLYGKARPGADYEASLDLLRQFARRFPEATTTSGLFVGIGEEMDEIRAVMRDLRAQDCRMLTIRQYLAPADGPLAVARHVRPEELEGLRAYGEHIGFEQVASSSLVRSPYRADLQAAGILSATEPCGILIVDAAAEARALATAIGSVPHDIGVFGPREQSDYRLMMDNKPIVSRFLPPTS